MSNETDHTTTLHAGHYGEGAARREVLTDSNHGHVAEMIMVGEAGVADADRLALCWNSRDSLVEACERVIDRLEDTCRLIGTDMYASVRKDYISESRDVVETARAALALVQQ